MFDGVAYLPEEEHSRDTCILQAGGGEGVYLARLDLERLRRYRESEVHGLTGAGRFRRLPALCSKRTGRCAKTRTLPSAWAGRLT